MPNLLPLQRVLLPKLPADKLPSPRLANWGVTLWLLLSLIGFLDSTYLTVKHFIGGTLPCAVWNGCGAVTQSSYALLFGIPIALLGAGYYLLIFFLGVIYFERRRQWALSTASLVTVAGILVSVTLVNLQIFVIKAFCVYCLISAATTLLLFLLFFPTLRRLV